MTTALVKDSIQPLSDFNKQHGNSSDRKGKLFKGMKRIFDF